MPGKGIFGNATRAELFGIIGLCVVLVAFNMATAMLYPNIWCDEAMYSDPAINLATGKGFNSGSWYAQTSDRFYAGNTPLHPLVLSVWVRAFGFSPLSVRTINYLYLASGTFCLWWYSVRTGFITKFKWHALMVVLLATGSSISFSYRSARPDMIGFFLMALGLCATTIPSAVWRNGVLFALGILLPWAGLQLCPLLLIFALIVFAVWGWRRAFPLGVAGVGAGVGLLALYWYYTSHGVWIEFMASVAPHAAGRATALRGLK